MLQTLHRIRRLKSAEMKCTDALRRLVKRLKKARREKPLTFPKTGYATVPDDVWLEEEAMYGFNDGAYYPVVVGDVYNDRYQVVGKLGFGGSATVWLAKDLVKKEFVTIKIFTNNGNHRDEPRTCALLATANPAHPGHRRVRTALEIFRLERQDSTGPPHLCMVQTPLWERWTGILDYLEDRRFPLDKLKVCLHELFLGLDYLHTECKMIHTDIKGDNILQDLADKSLLKEFTAYELKNPCPRKVFSINGREHTVYESSRLGIPKKFGDCMVLSDFGSADDGKVLHDYLAQPEAYRAPEVILGIPWSYPIDIWSVGAMIWDFFEGDRLFRGKDPREEMGGRYSHCAHLAEIIAAIGPPPRDVLDRGADSGQFFTRNGGWIASEGVPIPQGRSLEERVTVVEGEEKEDFLRFVKGMLAWRPEDRKTAAELARDPWLHS